MFHARSSQRRGITLIELLVVLAILAFLMALLLPVLARTRLAATQNQTVNNLKQVGLAVHSAQDNFRRMPPAFDKFGALQFPAAIHVHLLPYIEQDNL